MPTKKTITIAIIGTALVAAGALTMSGTFSKGYIGRITETSQVNPTATKSSLPALKELATKEFSTAQAQINNGLNTVSNLFGNAQSVSDLNAEPYFTAGAVTLKWTANPTSNHYKVYYQDQTSGKFTEIGGTTSDGPNLDAFKSQPAQKQADIYIPKNPKQSKYTFAVRGDFDADYSNKITVGTVKPADPAKVSVNSYQNYSYSSVQFGTKVTFTYKLEGDLKTSDKLVWNWGDSNTQSVKVATIPAGALSGDEQEMTYAFPYSASDKTYNVTLELQDQNGAKKSQQEPTSVTIKTPTTYSPIYNCAEGELTSIKNKGGDWKAKGQSPTTTYCHPAIRKFQTLDSSKCSENLGTNEVSDYKKGSKHDSYECTVYRSN